jgi:uncharacterized protein (DUF4415 family)
VRKETAHTGRLGSGTELVLPERKVPISLRMDREVVEWFKAHGRRYQSRMNAVLKAYVQAHRKAG